MTAATPKNLVIRTDAGPRIGMGHAMRCLALGEAWQARYDWVVFVMAESFPDLDDRLISKGMIVKHIVARPGSGDDARQTLALAREAGADWIVADGYSFNGDYQEQLKDAGFKLMVIDDYGHADRYVADVVLNQNLGAERSLYFRKTPGTRLILGTRYALLRAEFAVARRVLSRDIPKVATKILVTLGGGDPDNVAEKVIRALSAIDSANLDVRVVIGGANEHFERLQAAAAVSAHRISLEHNADYMPELMAWADMAISAGGTTCWELCFLGLPNIVIVLADNQRSIAQGLSEAKASLSLGEHDAVTESDIAAAVSELIRDVKRREQMSLAGRTLVDGRGCERVIEEALTERGL